jgi:hypothetical protein
MKRIKAINGYTIYQASARDVERYNYTEGTYYIFFSSDIRDYGLAMSYPEWEDDNLECAIEWCSGTNYAIAREIVESRTTWATLEEIEEIEKQLDEMSAEEIADAWESGVISTEQANTWQNNQNLFFDLPENRRRSQS